MRLSNKIFLFLISFTFLFLVFKNIFPEEILAINLAGLSWLYSTIGLIFSIISAFIIQTEWTKWDNLTNSVKGEINNIKELIVLARQFSQGAECKIKSSIETYLHCLIEKESWKQLDRGQSSEEVESALKKLEESLFTASKEETRLTNMAFGVFSEIIKSRNQRMRWSSIHLPIILETTVTFATALIILLPLFIAVPNLLLNYIFTVSIGLLAFLIYTVIKDLDHPYQPGNWHLSRDDYKNLLEEIQ